MQCWTQANRPSTSAKKSCKPTGSRKSRNPRKIKTKIRNNRRIKRGERHNCLSPLSLVTVSLAGHRNRLTHNHSQHSRYGRIFDPGVGLYKAPQVAAAEDIVSVLDSGGQFTISKGFA